MNDTISADILRGADQIAAFLGFERRSVYHAVSNGNLPVFHVGSIVHARRSTLLSWIESQETGVGANDNRKDGAAA